MWTRFTTFFFFLQEIQGIWLLNHKVATWSVFKKLPDILPHWKWHLNIPSVHSLHDLISQHVMLLPFPFFSVWVSGLGGFCTASSHSGFTFCFPYGWPYPTRIFTYILAIHITPKRNVSSCLVPFSSRMTLSLPRCEHCFGIFPHCSLFSIPFMVFAKSNCFHL